MFFKNNEINNLEKQKSIMPTTLTEAKKKSWPLWPCLSTFFGKKRKKFFKKLKKIQQGLKKLFTKILGKIIVKF